MNRKKFIRNSLLGLGAISLSSSTRITLGEKPQTYFKPPPLHKGDTIAIFAPAGAVFSPRHVEKLEVVLIQQGYKVKRAANLQQQEGYFAGTDEERLAVFHELIADKTVKGLIAVRGGWGCARILPQLNLELIKANPKVIMGYSDLTSLLNYITDATGMITFHGPMAYSTWNAFTLSEFNANLVNQITKKTCTLRDTERFSNHKGTASGRCMGGNLTVLAAMMGTFYAPNFKDKILFLEETNEEPYVIDRMLTQLRDAGVFEQLKGIVLGKFNNCVAEFPEESLDLIDVFSFHFKDLNIPVFGFANFGHVKDKYILDIGRTTEINTENFSFTFVD